MAGLFTIARKWKQPQGPCDRWMDKQNALSSTQIKRNIYSAVRKKSQQMLPHGWTLLSETSQSQRKNKLSDFTHTEVPKVVRLTDTESRRVVAKGLCSREKEGELLFSGYRVSFPQDENIGHTAMWIYLTLPNRTLESGYDGWFYVCYHNLMSFIKLMSPWAESSGGKCDNVQTVLFWPCLPCFHSS